MCNEQYLDALPVKTVSHLTRWVFRHSEGLAPSHLSRRLAADSEILTRTTRQPTAEGLDGGQENKVWRKSPQYQDLEMPDDDYRRRLTAETRPP